MTHEEWDQFFFGQQAVTINEYFLNISQLVKPCLHIPRQPWEQMEEINTVQENNQLGVENRQLAQEFRFGLQNKTEFGGDKIIQKNLNLQNAYSVCKMLQFQIIC